MDVVSKKIDESNLAGCFARLERFGKCTKHYA
jgi:hypothetical protein